MKAVIVSEFGGSEVLEYQETDKPVVGDNQVFIRVDALSVNFADVKGRKGEFHGGAQPPFIPGLDAAGTVEAVGSNVTKFSPGQKVIAFPTGGSYAEYVVANEDVTYALPEGIDFETAAATPIVAFTSYHILKKVGRIEAGETVLIHGAAGGVGTTAIQLAKLLGAGKVIGTVGSDAKKDTAFEAGADIVINYNEEDFVEIVQQNTDGKGVDLILDPVAGETGRKSLESLAMYGRLVNFGTASGEAVLIQSSDLYSSCRSVLGFSLGTTIKQRPELLEDTAEAVLQYIADGKLNMFVGKRFPLSEASSAHDWIESRESTGKIILNP